VSGTTHEAEGLHQRSLGVADIVFFMVAASAPLTVIAGGLAVGYAASGNAGIPLLTILVAVILGIFAAGYTAMSRYVTSAGAFYSYVALGLGKVPGVAAAFIALVSYNAIQIGVYGLFGVAAGAFFGPKLGIHLEWWLWAGIAWAIVAMLGVLRIDLNARVLALAMVLECTVVAIFDVAGLANPGPQGVSLTGFDPSVAFGPAAGAAVIFCLISFFGFEQAAIYSEEAKDPRRTVPRATYIALISIAVFYAVSSWLFSVAAGPDVVTNFAAMTKAGYTSNGVPEPTAIFFIVGTINLGNFWGDAASLLFITSLFAALLSFHNAIARYAFALGREGILPRVFASVGRRTGAPIGGSVSQSLLAVIVFGGFALAGKDPVLDLFTWLPALGGIGICLLMSATSFAVFAFFRRSPDLDVGLFPARIAPLLAGVLLLALFVVMLANFNVLITGAVGMPTSSLTLILPGILLLAIVAGICVGLRLRQRGGDTYAGVGNHEEPPDPDSGHHLVREGV
jgi:amino acid transporter